MLKDYGHYSPSSSDYLARIVKLRSWLKDFIENLNKKDIKLTVAIEEIQLQDINNTSKEMSLMTFKKLAHLQGVVLELLVEMNIRYEIISSNTWKSKCGVKGKYRAEQKKNAQKFVFDTFGIAATEDEADAICIGKAIVLRDEEEINW